MTFALSNHAARRSQQRGVPPHLIDALMSYADFEAPVGGGCTVVRLTRDTLDDPDLVECLGGERQRLSGLSIVWSERTGEIVTILRPRRGSAGRRYRRGGH